jgi:hypothetical protein
MMDNTEIERIATPDLTSETLALLKAYGSNDDVVFFLGRLVWQGKMVGCVPDLSEIACDPSRGRYARTAAIRGVMAVGDADQKERLWEVIAEQPGPLDRALPAELVYWAPPNTRNIKLLLRALERVAPYKEFNTTGLRHSIHNFIERLPVMADQAQDHPLGRLVEGLNNFLGREPFLERGACHVSKAFAWLMPPALHAIDRLVAARSAQSLTSDAISVMRNMSALRFWSTSQFDDYKTALANNIPRWRELNDLLYWTSIVDGRAELAVKGQQLMDDWQVAYVGHFWGFGPADFERCLDWVRTKQGDDRFVALGRSIQLYIEADRPAAWLDLLRAAAAGDEKLDAMLEARINPPALRAVDEMNAEHRRWKRENEKRERKEKKGRADWVRALKADPDRVIHPAGLSPGELSGDQYHLLGSCMGDRVSTSRADGANWRALIPEFGEAVARAYRDAAVAHWRAYRPELRSEGADTSSTAYSLIFAMTGLAIEASEDSGFAGRLTEDEARLAFRYVTWELNGFPAWFEPLYRAFPDIGREAVTKELFWELDHTVAESPLHYVVPDILYHAPWLHADVSPRILEWLRLHDMPNVDVLGHCLNILASGGTGAKDLAELAAQKAEHTSLVEQRPRWFALWVDNDPRAAIPALEAALQEPSLENASAFAQRFIVGLLGDRHGAGVRVSAYRNASDLKKLYTLMHRYIRVANDIERAGHGVYSPTLRDNAQDARNSLFNMLVAVPGADAYAAIKALESDHPEPEYRRAMAVRAYERATMDADEPAWTTEQVRDFTRMAERGNAR